ncbi:DegT/DnrJ/EryC1/StrS family aminotransferase [Rhabdothermincola sp.]|uniref:DegT/DnrJ/EryC1/StrS family aminotransferase n=1 Tax=Rhabdothermincola sp. TaxID=2820405 RepID=UPI002FE37F95
MKRQGDNPHPCPPPVSFLDLGSMNAAVRAEVLEVIGHAIDRSSFIGGPLVERFEEQWARYCGVSHAVGVANGTDALILALRGLGIGPGDEVLVPTNTFVATAEAVLAAGATPVFVDVRDDTLLVDLDDAATQVGPRTAAVIAVHLYGQPADMDAVSAFARRHGLALVEDAAQAHGATWKGRPAGSFGQAGCFSFYPGKNLGAFGDAGAIVTDDDGLARLARSLGDHGRSVGSKHLHVAVGGNSRLDALQAAVLSAKLRFLDEWTGQRRRVAARYRAGLEGTSVLSVTQAPGSASAFHLHVVRTSHRDTLVGSLAQRGISTGIHYPVPCHQQPAFAGYRTRPLPIAEAAAREIVSLPLSPSLDDASVDRVCEVIAEVVLEQGAPASSTRPPITDPAVNGPSLERTA